MTVHPTLLIQKAGWRKADEMYPVSTPYELQENDEKTVAQHDFE